MTIDAEHLIRVHELCAAAELQSTGFGKGLNDSVNVTVRPDARTPQWIEARLRKEALKRGYAPYAVTFSGFMEPQWELHFTPAREAVAHE